MRLSLVLPVYNEKENLPQLAEELAAVVPTLGLETEVLFVDDGSRDGSAEVLRGIVAKHSWAAAVFFQRNFGQTAALSAGFARASGDVVIPLDADLQNDPKDIPLLLAELEKGFDVVSGWRRDRQDAFLSRILPSKIANACISWITRVPLHDYGCTLKAYRKSVLEDITLYGEMHRFIPAYAAWNGARVTEVVVHHRRRVHGTSKYGILRTFRVILDLFVVRFWTRYLPKPIHFFGGIGVVSFLAGVGAGVWAVWSKLFQDISFVETPLPLLCVFLVTLGVQFILMGLLAEILIRTYYEAQKKETYKIREIVRGGEAVRT